MWRTDKAQELDHKYIYTKFCLGHLHIGEPLGIDIKINGLLMPTPGPIFKSAIFMYSFLNW